MLQTKIIEAATELGLTRFDAEIPATQ